MLGIASSGCIAGVVALSTAYPAATGVTAAAAIVAGAAADVRDSIHHPNDPQPEPPPPPPNANDPVGYAAALAHLSDPAYMKNMKYWKCGGSFLRCATGCAGCNSSTPSPDGIALALLVTVVLLRRRSQS